MEKDEKNKDGFLRAFFSIVFMAVLIFVVIFRFQAGEQLIFRNSKGNLRVPDADGGSIELVSGTVILQTFYVNIECIESIKVQWGTYYRTNQGDVLIELIDTETSQSMYSQSFPAEAISEGDFTTIIFPQYIEGTTGKLLGIRITSNCAPGSAPSPLMSAVPTEEGEGVLYFDDEPVVGRLCFAVEGKDRIWLGYHYPFCAFVFLLLVACLLFYSDWQYYHNNRRTFLVNIILSIRRYRFLIKQLVARDFKTRYKRSVLGILWSVLSPLLTMIVQYFVFSTIFQSDIPYYGVYLLLGVTVFNFINEACGTSLTSIVMNASLINKVYVPKYIYPITKVISAAINFLLSLIPLIIVFLYSGIKPTIATPLAFLFMLFVVIFSMGIGLILSTAMVFFRDIQHLWSIFVMMWMYATPIFYPESILPDKYRRILYINPLYYFFKAIRQCVIEGTSPDPVVYGICISISLVVLFIGAMIFRNKQNRFILYI